jgi:hypothetical protein
MSPRIAVLAALLASATAFADSLEADMPAVTKTIGGQPEQTVYGTQTIGAGLHQLSVALVYREQTFWLFGAKAQVRSKFRCDEIRSVTADVGPQVDGVIVQTSSDLLNLKIFAKGDTNGLVPKMIDTLKGCAKKKP